MNKDIAVIFDMDGVLFQSQKYIWRSFMELLKPYGEIKFTDKEIRTHLGASLRDTVEVWNKKYKLKIDHKKFSQDATELELEFMAGELVADKGVIRLLKELKNNKISMAVGTASQGYRAKKMLKILKVSNYFPVVISADDTHKHKPDPEIFLLAAEGMKILPAKCVVLEDSESGIKAANYGGMKSIGVKTAFNTEESLKTADLIIQNFSELSLSKIDQLFYQ